MISKKYFFLEIEFGMYNSIKGVVTSKDYTELNLALAILGCVSPKIHEILKKSENPIKYIRDNFPNKIAKLEINLDLYLYLEDYNYVFTIYGRTNFEIFEKSFEEIKLLKEKEKKSIISTINDEYFINPYSYIIKNKNICRETYLEGFEIRSITSVRNYLYYVDPYYLKIGNCKDILKLLNRLFELNILKKVGLNFVPKKHIKNHDTYKKSKFPKLYPLKFSDLLPYKKKIIIDIEEVILIDNLKMCNDDTLIVYMFELKNERNIYRSSYFEKAVKQKKFTKIVFVFENTEKYLLSNTPHYNYLNCTRLNYVVFYLKTHINRNVKFYSYIYSSNRKSET